MGHKELDGSQAEIKPHYRDHHLVVEITKYSSKNMPHIEQNLHVCPVFSQGHLIQYLMFVDSLIVCGEE